MKYNIILLFLTSSIISYSQTDIVKQINTLMTQIRLGNSITIDKSKIINSSGTEVTKALSNYFNDTIINVRYEALSLNTQIALKQKDKTNIKKSIQDNIDNCIVKGSINNQITNLLKKYSKNDFTQEELGLINNTLQSQENNIGTLAKIYAFAGQESVLYEIRALLGKQALTKNDKKDIKLALVRCGDEGLSSKMLETLKQQVVNDELIYSALSEIIYTRNKSLYDHILNAILDDSKKCSSANNDDNTPIICAYRLIEQLAPTINNFPVTINEKGEINNSDLKKTLLEVRTWILKNKNDLNINKEFY